MVQTYCPISGECFRKFRCLNLLNVRNSSDDTSYVIKEIASKIFDRNKAPDKPHVNVSPKVNSKTFKDVASKIITNGKDTLTKKINYNAHPEQIARKIMIEYPEPPTTCCMSGCANCVWIDYAEKMSKYFENGDEKAIKEIQERITDESLKAFLLHEIRMRNKIKKKTDP